jgi:hypothetical protein
MIGKVDKDEAAGRPVLAIKIRHKWPTGLDHHFPDEIQLERIGRTRFQLLHVDA